MTLEEGDLQTNTGSKSIKGLIGVTLCALLIGITVPEFLFHREKSRRRHQMEQLWTLIHLHYVPSHADRYPNDLAELRSLPMYSTYSTFFGRAIQEVELLAPGIQRNIATPGAVVLKERTADSRGFVWVHHADGSLEYRREP
jgi:hypothetical protein